MAYVLGGVIYGIYTLLEFFEIRRTVLFNGCAQNSHARLGAALAKHTNRRGRVGANVFHEKQNGLGQRSPVTLEVELKRHAEHLPLLVHDVQVFVYGLLWPANDLARYSPDQVIKTTGLVDTDFTHYGLFLNCFSLNMPYFIYVT